MDEHALRRVYRRAALIRAVDLEVIKRYYPNPADKGDSPMRCPVHLHMGSEVLAATVAEMLSGQNVHIYGTHRSHAPYLAFGGDLNAMVAEMYGKATGCAGGWGGSMHLVDREAGFMGASAIVGSIQSVAVGDALAARLDRSDRLVIVWMGEAGLESGQFHEAWEFSELHQLRILWVVEDNGYATATPLHLRKHEQYVRAEPTPLDAVEGWLRVTLDETDWPNKIQPSVQRLREHVGVGVDDWRPEPDDRELIGLRRDVDRFGLQQRVEIDVSVESQVSRAFAAAEAAPWPEIPWQL